MWKIMLRDPNSSSSSQEAPDLLSNFILLIRWENILFSPKKGEPWEKWLLKITGVQTNWRSIWESDQISEFHLLHYYVNWANGY